MADAERYGNRGVSSGKGEVHQAARKMDPGIFPTAFCKVMPDFLTGDPEYCVVIHADTAGTKPRIPYLLWKDLKLDPQVYAGLVRDALNMNLTDAGCVGALGPFGISGITSRNKLLIPGDVLDVIFGSVEEFCDLLGALGFECHLAGGETADVGDILRTLDVAYVVMSRMRRDQVIDAGRMVPGDVIIGYASTGQALYELQPNSGAGCNGYTNLFHELLGRYYAESYPETYAPEMPPDLVCCGRFRLEDILPGTDFTVGQALLSPTRTYLPVIKHLIEILGRDIHGLIHATGGGQTKIGKFGAWGNRYCLDQLLPLPPFFAAVLEYSKLGPRELFSTLNCGYQLLAVVPAKFAHECLLAGQPWDIEARVLGRVEQADDPDTREVVIQAGKENYTYLEKKPQEKTG